MPFIDHMKSVSNIMNANVINYILPSCSILKIHNYRSSAHANRYSLYKLSRNIVEYCGFLYINMDDENGNLFLTQNKFSNNVESNFDMSFKDVLIAKFSGTLNGFNDDIEGDMLLSQVKIPDNPENSHDKILDQFENDKEGDDILSQVDFNASTNGKTNESDLKRFQFVTDETARKNATKRQV